MKRNRVQWRDDLSRASWQDFERLLARHFESRGFAVDHCGTAGSAQRFDGGVDLVLRKDGEVILVQCKHWNVAQVPHNDVHQLIGLVETRGASRGILASSGEFTRAAREAASRTSRVELMDGAALRAILDASLIPSAKPGGSAPSLGSEAWAPVAGKGGRRGRRRMSPEDALRELGFKLAFALVLALLMFLFVRHQLGKLEESLTRPVVRPAAAAAPAKASTDMAPVVQQPRANPSNPMGKVPTSPDELREWERKNAEAMEILEKTTPSVYD
ncbi:MAG: restriction endonuclease [Rhizobium sp.]|nr:restriction endonuclease [Rhizobium sp.]